MIAPPGKRLFYRVEEVARKLAISRATIYRRIDDGSIPSIRFRGCIRIPVDAFEQLLREKAETRT